MPKLPTDPLTSIYNALHKSEDPLLKELGNKARFRGAKYADLGNGNLHITGINAEVPELRTTKDKLADWWGKNKGSMLHSNEADVHRYLTELSNIESLRLAAAKGNSAAKARLAESKARAKAIEDRFTPDALHPAAQELLGIQAIKSGKPASDVGLPGGLRHQLRQLGGAWERAVLEDMPDGTFTLHNVAGKPTLVTMEQLQRRLARGAASAETEATPTGYRKINVVPHTTVGTPTDEVVSNVLAEIAEVSTPILEQRLAQKLAKRGDYYGKVADNIDSEIAAIRNEIKARGGAQFRGAPATKQRRPSADDIARASAAQAEQLKDEFDLAHGGPVESSYQHGNARVIIASKGERVVPKKGGPSKQDIADEKALQSKVKKKLGKPERYAEGGLLDNTIRLMSNRKKQIDDAVDAASAPAVPVAKPAPVADDAVESSDDMLRRMTREAREKNKPPAYARGGIIGRIDAAAAKQKQQASKRI